MLGNIKVYYNFSISNSPFYIGPFEFNWPSVEFKIIS